MLMQLNSAQLKIPAKQRYKGHLLLSATFREMNFSQKIHFIIRSDAGEIVSLAQLIVSTTRNSLSITIQKAFWFFLSAVLRDVKYFHQKTSLVFTNNGWSQSYTLTELDYHTVQMQTFSEQ